MYGGCPPWGTITPSDRVLAIRISDTGDDLRVALARFTGTDPDGTTYDEPDIALLAGDAGGEPLATVTGTAADLDTWLWHRGAGRVEPTFDGDEGVLDELRAYLSQPLN